MSNQDVHLDLEVLKRLKNFYPKKKLQQQLLLLLVNLLDPSETEKSKTTFRAIDSDFSGIISRDELKAALDKIEDKSQSDEVL
jgi:Ca2+-binding EF-hand superfamily protein